MKLVLMIAPYFVPRRRVGALRPFKFSIHLRKYGYTPVILTIGNSGGNLTEKEKFLLDGIKVIEVASPIDRTEKKNDVDQESENPKGLSGSVMNWIDKQTPLDSWIYLFQMRYSWILKKVKKLNPELIWATGDPWSGLWLGEKLSSDLQKPFVADFRDPWTLTRVNLRARSSFSSGIDREAEKKVITRADKLIFTSQLTEMKYTDHYQLGEKKSTTIYNSFDTVLARPQSSHLWDADLDDEMLNLIFFGRFRRLSPVNPVANALKVVKEKFPRDIDYIRIHSFGRPDAENNTLIKELGLEENFLFHEPVVPENMIPVLKSADILLLSTNMEREEIIPAKLWDYLSVEKPIFSIAPNPEVGEIIMKSKSGLQVHPEEKAEIAEILHSFARAKRNNDTFLFAMEENLPDRNMYESQQTTRQLAAIFDELTSDA
jgi:glycosyltransferase involved in cell wall biosynthesis